MTDSYVFYNSFHQAFSELSNEQYGEIMRALNEYALNDIEPVINDSVLRMAFTLIKPQIDANKRRRETGRQNGKKGGRPLKLNNPQVTEEKTNGFLENNANVNVNGNVNVNENVNEKLNSLSLSPMQKNYSKLVFDIFKTNGLPCCNGNELSFMQRDFYNGRGYIQRQDDLKALHTDDVLQACRNYGEVYNDPQCYYKKKMDFYSFVQSKQFWHFLPSNFDKSAWLKFEIKAEQPKDENAERSAICPKCKTKHYYWSNDLQIFKCSNCGLTETFEENEARGD